MGFTRLTRDMNIIQKLDDEPNDVGGMTSAELKAKFDEPGNAVKEWINETFIPEAERELKNALLGQIDPTIIPPYQIGAKTRDNLLINADFRNPVNRNGGSWLIPPGTPYYSDTGLTAQVGTLTEYTTGIAMTGVYGGVIVDGVVYYVNWTVAVRGYNGTKYTIDRWKSNNAATVLSDSGLTVFGTSVYGNLSQLIENAPSLLAGKTVTLSALITGGSGVGNGAYINMFYKSDVEQAAYVRSVGVTSLTLTLPDDMTLLRAGLVSSSTARQSLDVKAAKLELGPVQTLARQLDDGTWELIDPPNYALQYALCSLYSPTTGEWVGYQHSNPTLLDNGYFADPIDQRQGYVVPPGVMSYHDAELTAEIGISQVYAAVVEMTSAYCRTVHEGVNYYYPTSTAVRGYAGAGRTIDRWKQTSTSGAVLIFDDRIEIKANEKTNYFIQPAELIMFQNMIGYKVTSSVLYRCNGDGCYIYSGFSSDTTYNSFVHTNLIADGDIHLASGSGAIPVASPILFEPMGINVSPGATVTIYAAKFELGPVQTLAHQDADGNWVLNDPPPNKALELAKCQRYYRTIDLHGALLFARNANSAKTDLIQLTPPMRIKPSYSLSAPVKLVYNNTSVQQEAITFEDYNSSNNSCSFFVGGFSTLVPNTTYYIENHVKLIADAGL